LITKIDLLGGNQKNLALNMRSKIILIALPFILFLLSNCVATHTATYDMSLVEVSRPAEAVERYGELEITDADTSYYFEDDFINTVWIPMGELFLLDIENKTENSISIIWDESALVTPRGTSKSILHGEVRRIDAQRSIPPTVIVSGSRSELFIGTMDGFEGKGDMPRSIMLTEGDQEGLMRFQELTSDLVGEQVRVLLALQVRGTVLEYNFSFNINDVTYN